MSDTRKNQIITLVTFAFGILFSIIGFFSTFTLHDIKEEIKNLRSDINKVSDSVSAQSKTNNIQDFRLSILENYYYKNKNERNSENGKLENNGVWNSINCIRNR